jgi:uncharacterized protein
MKLQLDGLTAKPEEHRHSLSVSQWRVVCRGDEEPAQEVLEDFTFVMRVHMVSDDVFVDGVVNGVVRAECSRCLKRYRCALHDDFRLALAPARDRCPPDPEGEESLSKRGLWLGEELEAGWYRGREIDLDAYLAEVIALAMPVQPVCRADCKGLCPHCGVLRSEASCDCEEELKPRSPFAALAALQGDSGGNS